MIGFRIQEFSLMGKKFLLLSAVLASSLAVGCSSALGGLCDQYAAAVKEGNFEEMQRLTALINDENSSKSTGEQLKWLGDCMAKHGLDK